MEFLAVEVLSTLIAQPYNWAGHPMLGRLPGAVAMLSALQASGALVLLLAVAMLLQALQSLAQLARSVCVGYFAARCTALVKGRIHSQVLSFSFPCVSRYKVGNPTNYVSGPVAVRNQIEACSGLPGPGAHLCLLAAGSSSNGACGPAVRPRTASSPQ